MESTLTKYRESHRSEDKILGIVILIITRTLPKYSVDIYC